jgi:hypothetical protein
VATFEDFIRDVGAPYLFFTDNANAETCNRVKEILRIYTIKDHQSEPHNQHQNYAERRIQIIKQRTNTIMDRTGTPACFWLLAALFVIGLLNVCSSDSLNNNTPHTKVYGTLGDLSPYLQFCWWEPVFYSADDSFPATKERAGIWAGPAEKQGDALTYLIVDGKTEQVVTRSVVRTALDPMLPNHRALPNVLELPKDDKELKEAPPIVKDAYDHFGVDPETGAIKIPNFSPEELLNRTFLHDLEDGTESVQQSQRRFWTRMQRIISGSSFLLSMMKAALKNS